MEDQDLYMNDYYRRVNDELVQREWEEDETRVMPGHRKAKADTEYLGLVSIGSKLHCGFPTAHRTLCLLEPEAERTFWSLSPHREILYPTCGECRRILGKWMEGVRGGYDVEGIPATWEDAYVGVSR